MIDMKNVTYRYNTVRADGQKENITGISGFDLHIERGEFVLLTGSSGCGKTTVIRLINGLIPNFYNGEKTGEVLIDGKNTKDMSIYDISKRVGSVFQNPRTQFFNVNTTDELAFAAENQCVEPVKIKERIGETATYMDIEDLLERNIFELSGGQKQIVACAGVDVVAPDIIVLDEPSSNLDHQAIRKLERVLRTWKEEGKTIIIAEHRLFYLKDLVDKMIVMDSGQITAEYDSDALKKLTYEQLENLGLRPLELESIPYKSCEKATVHSNIEIRDMSFTYKDKRHGIEIDGLSIPKGSITAIIGRNGAGKSTLIHNICGLEKRCKGVMIYDGKRMGYKDRLHNCYMIMQDVNHQLFTESVLDEVMLSMTDKKQSEEDKRACAMAILEDLGLAKYAEAHPMALSGGQKQRTAIASGIASKKPVIILDEPTSGLDLYHMRKVAKQMKELSSHGKTLLIVTHDYEFILKCCEHIVCIEDGKVKESYELNEATVSNVLNQLR
ncbi:MAG: energy-coupling factor ABC transporter ATP-binding protein [Lachnospiraceae bacterium]|nr:energy-coupling factor ABC transporter ATP-binding protein [Lachnospiraceae bacterium]